MQQLVEAVVAALREQHGVLSITPAQADQVLVLAVAASGGSILVVDPLQLQDKARIWLELETSGSSSPRRMHVGSDAEQVAVLTRRLEEQAALAHELQCEVDAKNLELEHLARQSEDTHNALELRILDLEGQVCK